MASLALRRKWGVKTVREAKKLERRFLSESKALRRIEAARQRVQAARRGNGGIPEGEVDDRGNALLALQIDRPKFKVEKDVPMPQLGPVYPLREMEVGDSFSCPLALRARVEWAVGSFEKQHPATRFTIRIVDETSCRVWRIK